jgi:predicted Zn-dependent protease
MKKIPVVLLTLLVVFLIGSCARNPVTKRKQVVFMSEAQEIQLGKESDPQIIAEFGLYQDSSLQLFINQKGREMTAISHRPKLDYQFRIVDSEVLNAFAVPGGYVYFTRGIMAYFNNEAEFAGVLGHEIGHIAARHSVKQQRDQILGQVGLIAGIVLAPGLAQLAEPASQGLQLLFLKFSRDAERQSDELGVEYSTKIGYDATEMAGFFNTLSREGAKSGAGEIPEFLSTHPDPGSRNKTVGKLATDWKKKLNVSNPLVNRNTYLKRVEGLVYGEDPRQGYLENSIYYHPELRFQFAVPTGWQYQNTPSRVQMATKDGKAAMMLMPGKGSSPKEAANAFLEQNKLQPLDAKETTVNGLKAVAVIADAQAQQGQQPIRTSSYFIQYGQSIYLLIGMSSAADFKNYAGVFSSSQQSFKELTDAAKINKSPERIRLVTARSVSTLEQVLKENNVSEDRMEQHAILNGMALKDNVEAGMMLKVVRR